MTSRIRAEGIILVFSLFLSGTRLNCKPLSLSPERSKVVFGTNVIRTSQKALSSFSFSTSARVRDIRVTVAYGREFHIESVSCVEAEISRCNVSISFHPKQIGARTDSVLLSDPTVSRPVSVALVGVGLGAQATSIWSSALGLASKSFEFEVSRSAGGNVPTPVGLAADNSGFLYVTDPANNTLIRLSPKTGTQVLLSESGMLQLSTNQDFDLRSDTPGSVQVDGAGTIYISHSGSNAIRSLSGSKLTPVNVDYETGTHRSAGCGASPSGLAVDSLRNLFVADSCDKRIWEIGSDNRMIAVGGGGRGEVDGLGSDVDANRALFECPCGLSVGPNGDIYVADTGNNMIRVIRLGDHKVQTVAGTGATGYSGDGGVATQSTLNHPVALAFDPAGDIFVADAGNNVIREIEAATGKISTLPCPERLDQPSGIVFVHGDIFVADTGNHRVVQIGYGLHTFASLEAARSSGAAVLNTGNMPLDDLKSQANASPRHEHSPAITTTQVLIDGNPSMQLRNNDQEPLNLFGISLLGDGSQKLTLTTTCGPMLQPLESCTISVISGKSLSAEEVSICIHSQTKLIVPLVQETVTQKVSVVE